jgi:hypothetical protein
VLTDVCRLCGHRSIGPSLVLDQSMVRISAPNSLLPDKKSREEVAGSPALLVVIMQTLFLTFGLNDLSPPGERMLRTYSFSRPWRSSRRPLEKGTLDASH